MSHEKKASSNAATTPAEAVPEQDELSPEELKAVAGGVAQVGLNKSTPKKVASRTDD